MTLSANFLQNTASYRKCLLSEIKIPIQNLANEMKCNEVYDFGFLGGRLIFPVSVVLNRNTIPCLK